MLLFSCAPCPRSRRRELVKQPDGTLLHVYPAGGQRGTAVPVEFASLGGLDGTTGVVIDGPPGVSVKDFQATATNQAKATLVIAADAVPGPRLVRVVGGRCGITSSRLFFVGTIPEAVEKEPNDTPDAPQAVALPVVVNGRIDPALDTDCYRFDAKAGQRVVAAVLAHGMDSRMRTRANNGFVDASLELFDAKGKVLASAEDTLGLDPVIEHVIPADGRYTVRVFALGFEGAPGAVYRLTIGDVPYPTAVFPAGAQRGKPVDAAFSGFGMSDSRQKLAAPGAALPWQTVRFDQPLTDGRALPFITGDVPEVTEAEPNDTRDKATPLPFRGADGGITANGRFDRPGDVDWYRVTLKKGQGVVIEVAATRHLRSPVDTALEVTDAGGKKLAENDDGSIFAGQVEHDFPCPDSALEFVAPADGDYFLRVSDQNSTSGPRAVYRLTVSPLQPDFRLHQWPDAVPVWGPGSSAAFVVEVRRWGGLTADIQLKVEGLPPGWKGCTGIATMDGYLPPNSGTGQKVLLTITAPADAKVGDTAAFRVVGRAAPAGAKVIEHEAYPQTLLGNGAIKRMHLRYSPGAGGRCAAARLPAGNVGEGDHHDDGREGVDPGAGGPHAGRDEPDRDLDRRRDARRRDRVADPAHAEAGRERGDTDAGSRRQAQAGHLRDRGEPQLGRRPARGPPRPVYRTHHPARQAARAQAVTKLGASANVGGRWHTSTKLRWHRG